MSSADTQKPKQSESKKSEAKDMSTEIQSRDVSTLEDESFLRTLGAEFVKSMPSPKLLPDYKRTQYTTRIESLVGAKSAEDKRRLRYALVHLGIEHGTGPNADYKSIKLVPGGSMRSVTMDEVVDKIVTREYWRRYMNGFGDDVRPYLAANPQLLDTLAERATRNGVPLNNIETVVDFGVPKLDNPDSLGLRHIAKTNAVNRANSNTDNSVFAKTKNAVYDAQHTSAGSGRSSAAQHHDRYGPV